MIFYDDYHDNAPANKGTNMDDKLELPDSDGFITHINGQLLLNPVPFKRGEMMAALASMSGEKVILRSIEWVEV